MQTDFGWMLVRLCYAGPLLYIGLAMALDPAGFVRLLSNLARGIRSFQQQLQGLRGQPLPGEGAPFAVSRGGRMVFQLAGAALALVALLHLMGVVT